MKLSALPMKHVTASHFLIPLGILLSLIPGVPAAAALVAGVAIALTVGNPYLEKTKPGSRKLLSTSVVGLGASMHLGTVVKTGLEGAGWTALLITGSLFFGTLLARAMKLSRNTGLLVSAGTAICGGSAIAAVAPVIGAKDEEVAVSLATVFLLNGAALFVFPPIGHLVGLSGVDFGHWAALAIHDTSSVVGAALSYGDGALEVATTTKLARALWIVPMSLVLAKVIHSSGTGAKPARPWFIAGFLAVSAAVTFLPVLQPAGEVVAMVARRMLVVSLFLIGANLSRSTVRAMGLRPMAHGVILWVGIAGITLAAIHFG